MAYLDLAADVPVGAFRQAALAAPIAAPATARLSGAERSAVMLARIDNASSLNGQSFVRKALRFAFGIQPSNKLADIRLETLRRFAVAVAHGRTALAQWEMNELRLLRFEESQIDEAASLASTFIRESHAGLWLHLIFAVAVAAAFIWVRGILGETMTSTMIVAVLALPVWALIAPRSAGQERHR